MPRVFVLVLLLALPVASASAQRRGGGGGGMRGGMRGPGVSSGARVGFRGGVGFSGRGFVGGGFVAHGGFVGHRPFAPVRRFHNRYYGYAGVYAYPYYGYPYYDTLGYSSYDSSYEQANYANQQNQQQVSQQLYELSSEVRELRDQNDQLRYDLEKRRYRGDEPTRPSPIPQAAQAMPETPAAVFVFKSGVSVDTHNYAIVGQTLWVLSPQKALKYPLAQLDYDATKKANADRGLDVTLPALASTPAKPTASSPAPLHGD